MLRTKFLEAMPAELRFQMQADDPLIEDVCLWTDTGPSSLFEPVV